MKTYLVGGAVRDRLLGQTVSEKDWVVVGATEGEMLALGFREVGKGFPSSYILKLTRSMLWPESSGKSDQVTADFNALAAPT